MKLSKREYKCRMKFIQECHYDKEEQRIFDEAHETMGIPYKEMYRFIRSGQIYCFMLLITSKRLGKAICNCGVSADEATEALFAACKEFAKKEGECSG